MNQANQAFPYQGQVGSAIGTGFSPHPVSVDVAKARVAADGETTRDDVYARLRRSAAHAGTIIARLDAAIERVHGPQPEQKNDLQAEPRPLMDQCDYVGRLLAEIEARVVSLSQVV